MNYNMKLHAVAYIEKVLQNIRQMKLRHQANADMLASTKNGDDREHELIYHLKCAELYEDEEYDLNQVLIFLAEIDDDIKWALYHLDNMADLQGDILQTTLDNIKGVLVDFNYVKEGK